LVGLGSPAGDSTVRTESVTDVVKLLRRPFPRGQELQSCLSLCAACPAPNTHGGHTDGRCHLCVVRSCLLEDF
jgi:hypothetical protein